MSETGDMVERVARAIAPMICRPVYNGDCDDVSAGQDYARRVATAALAASGADRMREALEVAKVTLRLDGERMRGRGMSTMQNDVVYTTARQALGEPQ